MSLSAQAGVRTHLLCLDPFRLTKPRKSIGLTLFVTWKTFCLLSYTLARASSYSKSFLLSDQSSTQNIQKLPSITLSISYRGVSFRDSMTAIAICDHEVRNIHCAAQDDDDLRFLAYITKDVHVNKHFCHVFKAESMVQWVSPISPFCPSICYFIRDTWGGRQGQ